MLTVSAPVADSLTSLVPKTLCNPVLKKFILYFYVSQSNIQFFDISLEKVSIHVINTVRTSTFPLIQIIESRLKF